MTKKDTILCIDIEATCWDDRDSVKKGELIEFGYQEIDIASKTLIGEPVSLLVKPSHTEVSKFCTNLTTITPSMVENAPSFFNTMTHIRKNVWKDKMILASWGQYDVELIRRQTKEEKTGYFFGNNHLNVKMLFAAIYGYTGGVSEMGKQLGIEFEGTPHRGHYDALMTAKILIKLLQQVAVPV